MTQTTLKIFRQRRGYTQRELAKKSGVSLSLIRKIEGDKERILHARIDAVIALSKALRIKPERLYNTTYS